MQYGLSRRQAFVTRILAGAFMILAVVTAGLAIVALATPQLAIRCDGAGCLRTEDAIMLLPKTLQAVVRDTPEAAGAFAAHLASSWVKIGMAALRLLSSLPLALLLLAVGLALRHLASSADVALERALPWLRRAALMSLVVALAAPISRSLEMMLLLPGTPEGAMWYLDVDLRALAFGLLLAGAAYAAVWALDAGLHAQRDAAGFI